MFDASSRPVVAAPTSDQDGRFSASGLSPGRYTVFAVRPTQWVGNSIPMIDVQAGADTMTSIYMTRSMSLLTPAHETSVGVPVTFTWEQVPGTTRYELYLTEVGSTCTPPAFQLSARPTYSTSTSASVSTLVVGKRYWWTVKATDQNSDLAWYAGPARCVLVR